MNKESPELVLNPASHTYTRGGIVVPGISEILKSVGMVDDRWFTEYSRDRGTGAHLACQFYDEGDLDESSVDPAIRPYLEAWKKFRTESGFIPELIEKKLYHSGYCYAGTEDRYGLFNASRDVVEIKTGMISAVTGLQLAAQELLLRDNGFEVHRRFAVQIKADGKYKLTEYTDPWDKNVFISCVSAHNFKIQHNIIGRQ